MSLFQNRILLMLSALLALLVFSGDVLDDVWNFAGAATAHSSQSSGQHKGGSPKTNAASHDDTVVLNSPLGSLAPALASAVQYLDVDEDAPVGAPPAIDHPPQLA